MHNRSFKFGVFFIRGSPGGSPSSRMSPQTTASRSPVPPQTGSPVTRNSPVPQSLALRPPAGGQPDSSPLSGKSGPPPGASPQLLKNLAGTGGNQPSPTLHRLKNESNQSSPSLKSANGHQS